MLSQSLNMGGTYASGDSAPSLQNLCRMCASSCLKPVLIFGPEGIENELSVKFNNYLPVKVSESDTLPLQLCYECTNLLIQWDAAVIVAIAADKKLKALQWREQQSQHLGREKPGIVSEPIQAPKTQSSSSESLSCSVCKKTGMEFRELVTHLKNHDMPSSNPEKSSVTGNESTIFDLEQEIDEGLLQPIVCLETPGEDSRSSPKKRTSEGLEKSSPNPGRRRHKKKDLENDTEGDSGDPVVTSSTSSTNLKPQESCGGDLRKDADQTTFKPKVRIISAESINQSLEERAKANQMARKVELQKSQVPVARPLEGDAQIPPRKIPSMPSNSNWTKVIIPGNLVKAMSSPDNSFSKPKFIKLADGRVMRLLGSLDKSGKPHRAVLCTSSPTTQQIPQSVLSQMTAGQRKLPISLVPRRTPAIPTSLLNTVSPVIVPVSVSKDNRDASGQFSPPLKENVKVGPSRIITFNLQPGPKHSATRYTCMFCGKRNLLHEALHEHAQSHTPKKDDANPNRSSLSESD